MSLDIGVSANKANEEQMESPKMLESIWNIAPNDNVRSVAAGAQIYSKTFQKTLKVSYVTFKSLHVTL